MSQRSRKADPPSLGDLEQLVMLAVIRLEEDAYGVSIHDQLSQVARRRLSRATVYVTLQRLEEKGLLQSRLADPTPERGGRAKRYYQATPRGETALRAAIRAIGRMTDGLGRWLEPTASGGCR